MSILLIDAGNTSLKWTLLKKSTLSCQQRCDYNEQSPISCVSALFIKQKKKIKKLVMVSVLGTDFVKATHHLAVDMGFEFINIASRKKLAGVINAYDEPTKLGADRFVALIASYHLFLKTKTNKTEQVCIIIDSGTATTIDAVDATGQHLGGLILPGLNICTKSLLESTKQLNLNDHKKAAFQPSLFATNTTQAIKSASVIGLAGAIEAICSKMEKQIQNNTKIKVTTKRIICGGGAKQLLPHLAPIYHLENSLILSGLKIIVETEKL